MNGQRIPFDVNGQPASGYLPSADQPASPGGLVLHAWRGLNSFFEDLCQRLASEGFVAFAPDLYDGKIAKTVPEAEQLIANSSSERKQEIATAAIDVLRSRREVIKEAISLIGFSMGAAWALELA